MPSPADRTIDRAANLLPFANYISRNSYPTDLARNLLLIEELAPQLATLRDYIDIADTFRTATGISPRQFCQLSFSVAVKFITNVETHMNDPGDAFLLTTRYFQHSAAPAQDVQTFLARLTTTPAALRQQAQRDTHGADFLMFQRCPPVEYEAGTYLCIDPGFLLDKAGPSLYWILHEATNRRHDLLTY
jgi:hypothetical protein